ncbi:AbrB family transcriptional regulator [Cohnella endophytica]|uniref:AbrB family transcriptional regulator n=1 Tax=Cohnella endophytica TaxID=2419778 RepID=A0A494XB75_9BACL|nr:AbrB family transcriptional regulator [Cohnella endophytica]RKP48005.1 AbrB family transcriptional regulator [Cohnella endophytica]
MAKSTKASTSFIGYGLTLVIALVFGYLFTLIRMPIPWLLGPMIGVCLVNRLVPSAKLKWPGSVRNAGLVIVGYTIGLSFTHEALLVISGQLPSMILLTVMLLLFCALIAFAIAKIGGVSFPTALTGSIPGGLTQMVALAEETKGIDLTVVAFLQVSRLMMIVVFVPLIIFSPLTGATHSNDLPAVVAANAANWGDLFPDILPYAIVCTALALIGKKINFPTAFLLAPLIGAAILHLSGLHAPILPSTVMQTAQLMIGCYVGLLLSPENLPNKARIVTLALGSGVVLIIGACGLSYLMTLIHPVSTATSLLSLSPGGMDQMGIIAHEIGADVSVVTCYQLFRTFFIFFAVPPLLRILFKRVPFRA